MIGESKHKYEDYIIFNLEKFNYKIANYYIEKNEKKLAEVYTIYIKI